MIVIKIGGAQVETPEMATVWAFIRAKRAAGEEVIMIHGGGPQTSALSRKLGFEPKSVQGRRVTGDADLQVLQWVIRGSLNLALSAQAVKYGVAALGLSGADAGIVTVTKRPPWVIDGETVDFGWVGDVQALRTAPLKAVLAGGYVPIVATMGIDAAGQVYNVNGDTVALKLAQAVQAQTLILLTDSGGLRKDQHDPNTHISTCNQAMIEAGIAEGWIQGGMMVKVQAALKALEAGVQEVWMIRAADVQNPQQGTRVVL